ncbi:helix-turn-helix domain-containing protein [Aquabacterium sp.]|uniref:helix-turn-helix domain-containing protein n=1 Tax=Aquabacterium sp. TaxID=1872578 RepID=UPI004037CE07
MSILNKTQGQNILAHLQKRRTGITPLEAIGVYKVYRLAAVIKRLRDLGWEITTVMGDDGVGGTYARYQFTQAQWLAKSKPLRDTLEKAKKGFSPEAAKPVAAEPYRAKVGDRVRIVKKVEKEADWNNGWAPRMDAYVGTGKVWTIGNVDSFGVYLQGDTALTGTSYGFPHGSLEQVKDEPVPTTSQAPSYSATREAGVR